LQTIQRAKLFGILGSLWVSRVDSPLDVFTDCLAIQSLIFKVFAQKQTPLNLKDSQQVANKLIIFQILDLLQQRAAHGAATKITWVKAHTGISTSIEYTMNADADHLANEARHRQDCHFNDCISFADRFFFRDEAGSLVESNPGTSLRRKFLGDILYKELELKIKAKSRQQSYHDPTLAYFTDHRDGVWSSASSMVSMSHRSSSPHLRRFLFELMTNSLPTIAQQYNLNKGKFSLLYPDQLCKCCNRHIKETAFHALCECPATELVRTCAFEGMASRLNHEVHNLNVRAHDAKQFVCSHDMYQRGLIAKDGFTIMESLSPELQIDTKALRKSIQHELISAFHSIWKDRNRLLNQNNWSFNARTKAVFQLNKRQFHDAHVASPA
jgi:hypothetical protein